MRERVRDIEAGSPFSATTTMGPLTSKAQFDKVCSIFEQASAEGLVPVVGGKSVDGPGFFVEPTIYTDVPLTSSLWRDEIFGPVLVVRTFATEAEALRLANDTKFGLAGGVISADYDRACRVADGIEAGNVWINVPQFMVPQGNWGGFKSSGFGRELGPAALSAFRSIKQVTSARP